MDTLIDIITLIFLVGTVFIILLIIGEKIASKIPNSRFTKWWRKYLIGDDFTEGEF